MTFILTLALAVLLVIAAYQATKLIVGASRGHKGRQMAETDGHIVQLQDEKERCLASLKELESDLEMRKLSQEDYDELRAHYEQRAVEVIRELREVERGSSARRTVVVMALGALLMGTGTPAAAQDLPAGHPPIDGGPAAMAGTVAASRDLDVAVWHTDASGATVPATSAQVIVRAFESRPGMAGAERIQVGIWTAKTAGDGVARLGRLAVPGGAEVDVMVLRDGAFFPAMPSQQGSGLLVARTYETTTDIGALSMRVQVDLAVEEGALSVRATYVFVNESPLAVDLSSREEPVFLPMVSPVAMGNVVARGWMPPQAPRHVSSTVAPKRGRIAKEAGGFAYRGLVLPGEITTVRLGYPLDYPADDMHVGLLAESLPLEEVLVAVRWGQRLQPQLRASVPMLGGQTEQGGQHMLVLKAPEPVPLGGELTMVLRHLPVHGVVGRRIATTLLIAGGFVLVVALLRSRATMGGAAT